jgi:aerotaxis receptor
MPAEAFRDMWATLESGRPWTALVKNRRKDGDHYWVRANVTPVRRSGKVTGYMSVRTQPSREEIDASARLYQAVRENKAGAIRFHKGIVVRTGLLAWTSVLHVMPVRWRIRSALATVALLTVAAAAALGIGGAALAGLAGASALLAVVAALWLQAQIATPLSHLLEQSLSVAAGQPAPAADFERIDEIGLIMRAVNQSGLNLRSLVDDVSTQISGMQIASGEIAQGNMDLSSRTEQTASSLQQTAASMEQMTASIAHNAEGSRQATQLAGDASAAAGVATTAGRIRRPACFCLRAP